MSSSARVLRKASTTSLSRSMSLSTSPTLLSFDCREEVYVSSSRLSWEWIAICAGRQPQLDHFRGNITAHGDDRGKQEPFDTVANATTYDHGSMQETAELQNTSQKQKNKSSANAQCSRQLQSFQCFASSTIPHLPCTKKHKGADIWTHHPPRNTKRRKQITWTIETTERGIIEGRSVHIDDAASEFLRNMVFKKGSRKGECSGEPLFARKLSGCLETT